MSHLLDPGEMPMATDDVQDAYDQGYRDGFDAGRKMERDEIALRLADDVAGRGDAVILGHVKWSTFKTKREAPDGRIPSQRTLDRDEEDHR